LLIERPASAIHPDPLAILRLEFPVTYAPSQIQALIDEIDGVLSKASPRVPWVMSGDVDRQRRVLQQTRECLVALQQQLSTAPRNGLLATQGTLSPEQIPPLPNGLPPTAESAQQVLQAVLQEMGYLRTNLMQPLRYELDMLRQQRDSLLQEIRSLETQKQQNALPAASIDAQQIAEMMQSMMAQMQQNLTAQVAQLLTDTGTLQLQESGTLGALPGTSDVSPSLTPTQRLELLHRLQSQSDQMLLKLDASTRVMYESLQSNVQTYQDSLEQGLGKLHTLGQQGEAIFSALITRLAQQLGRETSHYLQSTEPSAPLPQTPVAPHLAASNDEADDEISQLLEQLGGQATVMQPSDREPGTPSSGMRLVTGNVVDLSQLNQELDELRLEAPGSHALLSHFDEDLTFLQTDQPEANFDDDLTFLQTDQPMTGFGASDDDDMTLLQTNALASLAVELDTEEQELWQVDDLESAIDLLNDVPSELEALEDDQTIVESPYAPDQATDDELDELYASLFGDGTIANLDEGAEPPVDRFVAEARSVETLIQASSSQTADQDITVGNDAAGVVPDAAPAPSSAEPLITLEESTLEESTLEEDDLFGGLDDPAKEFSFAELEAPGTDAEPPTLWIAETEAETEIPIESLLFEPPPQPPAPPAPQLPDITPESELPSLEDFAHWQSVDEAVAHLTLPETADDRDIISSLSELVLPLEAESPAVAESTPVPIILPVEEDSFEPASPEEDLLAIEERSPTAPLELDVPDDTLQRLSADLSNFEQFGDPLSESEIPLSPFTPEPLAPVEPVPAQPADVASPPSNGTLPEKPKVQWADLFAEAEAVAPPELSPAPVDAIAEDLFTDFLVTPTVTPVDPPGNPAIRAALADLFDDAPAPQVSAEGPLVSREDSPAASPTPTVETPNDAQVPAEPPPPPLSSMPSDENLDDFFAGFSEDMSGDTAPDLSLEDFQSEMVAPSSEAIDRVTADMLMDLLKDDLPIAPNSALDSNLPAAPIPAPESAPETSPPVTPAEFFSPTEQPGLTESSPAPSTPEEEWGDLFSNSSLDDLRGAVPPPPAPEVPPDTLFSSRSTLPSTPAVQSAPETPLSSMQEESANAFTLEGLDSLFEDLPPISAYQDADPQAEHSLDDLFPQLKPKQSSNLLGVDFGSQASLDLYEDDPNAEEAKKKRF
jgi:hypothetical protein